MNMDSLNDPTISFEPSDLEAAAGKICTLRRAFLVDGISEDGSDLFAQEHFLLALAALDSAERHMRLAQYHQTRANAEGRR